MHALPDQLTPVQQQVLTLLATGSTVNAAAASVGVHRNTVANWRRGSESFRAHWAAAQHDQTMYWRDELQSCADLAIQALVSLLKDEKTPPSLRLRAALAVLDKVSSPPPIQPERKLTATTEPSPVVVHNPVDVHNLAQPLTDLEPDDPTPSAFCPETPRTMHNRAQSCTSAPAAAIPKHARLSRNALCSCGSGRKFKRCCLAKTAAA